ncbi:unnamed protein product [Phytophthora lilii]|uniref:Diphthine--ammonia ligase n=1 Tax=Phytophthora lilii TaxID=2077276 RepID=A0A9W6XCY1_9STRA|nr:unnamed protein product [Phytophthora lilii]
MATTSMTTLVIAHRLSTIRHADKIVVLNEGHIVESGTHEELLEIEHGIYHNMYRIQELRSQEEKDEAERREAESGSFYTKLARSTSGVSARTDISESAVEKNFLDKQPFSLMDIARLCKPEMNYFIIGMIGACVGGIAMPASALLITGMITSMTEKYGLYQNTGDRSYLSELYDKVELYGILYLVGAAVIAIFMYMQTYCFKFIEEKTTTRLRNTNFEGLCRQNVGFFDEKENATGALTADLATNATKVALLSGDSQARVFQAIFTLAAALVISFGFGSWLLSLIMLAIMPFLLFGHVARMKQMQGGGLISDDLAIPGAHASEVLSNIRTVAALGIEKRSAKVFDDLLEEPLQKGSKEAQINGVSLGFSSFIMMATYALIFWFGAKKVNDGTIGFTEMMRTLMAIMMSIQIVSGASTFMADAPKAFKAGSTIFAIRDRVTPIDSFSPDGLRLDKVEGRLEFKDISFRYPTRPEINVLKHYNLTVEAGQTVAFCGPSGGGKSTIISLIERFYDPVVGEVCLDGYNIKDLNLNWLRSQIGLVGQEPTLFIGTIADNISYGLAEQPSQQEIEEAAKMANAHDFITQFPDGYDTQVGMKGEQLSGGQKQRIAIARAILKNPNILLLDEATSALDSESEKVVQEALDKVVALKRRTTIVIAHRLSTIRRADKICVVSGGKIAEQGTHQELLQLNGIYAGLDAVRLPALTAARTAFTSSADTHNQVREALASAASLYRLHTDRLAALRPDVILTQNSCKVCSIDLASVQAAVGHDEAETQVDGLESEQQLTQIVTCNPTSLKDAVVTQFRQLGEALGVPELADEMANEHLKELKQLEQQAALFVETRGRKPKMLMVEWLEPLFLGTKGWMREIVEAAGGQVVESLDADTAVDVVVVALCGLTLDKTERELLEGRVGGWWKTLLDRPSAGAAPAVFIVDGTSMFTRPTRRLLVALEWLVHALHEPESDWMQSSTFPYKSFDTSLVASDSNDKNMSAEMLEIEELHRAACANKQAMYTDPATGYSVMTAYILKERQVCCGNGCRHCPYGHANVKDSSRRKNTLAGCVFLQPRRRSRGFAKDAPGGQLLWPEDAVSEGPNDLVVVFWSGGKDSFLALSTLYESYAAEKKPMPRVVLLTTVDPKTNVVPIQNIASQTIAAQAEALELPLCLVAVGLGDAYTSSLHSALKDIPGHLARAKKSKKAQMQNDETPVISSLVFGDLHLEDIRAWREQTFGQDYELLFPVWKKDYESELLPTLVRLCSKTGAKIYFSNVDEDQLGGADWQVGQEYDWKLVEERNKAAAEGTKKVDLMGECGEFHTCVKFPGMD